MKNDLSKAEIGYKWCLETLEGRASDQNTATLKALVLDWYSHFLTEKGDYKNALKFTEEAYNIYTENEGVNNEKSVLFLNDLATLHTKLGNYQKANTYLELAVKTGKELDNFTELGTIYANSGLVRMKLGLLEEAKKFCKEAWRLGNKLDNKDSIEQANYCFNQLNSEQQK